MKLALLGILILYGSLAQKEVIVTARTIMIHLIIGITTTLLCVPRRQRARTFFWEFTRSPPTTIRLVGKTFTTSLTGEGSSGSRLNKTQKEQLHSQLLSTRRAT